MHSSKTINPLLPLEPEVEARIQNIVKNTHQKFKEHVLKYRREKFKVITIQIQKQTKK